MERASSNGLVLLKSRSSFEETVRRLEKALQKRNLTLNAVIDHAADASAVGLSMPQTKLFIFGSPFVGTPAMVAFPSLAIDLPLKTLIQEDQDGVWVSYNAPEYLGSRHGLPEETAAAFSRIHEICREIAA